MDEQFSKIYLVRHGESLSNAFPNEPLEFHEQWGEEESPLSDNGIEQALDRAQDLKEIHFDAIFSSDLARAKQTAEIIKLERRLAVETIKAIRERRAWADLKKIKERGISFQVLQEKMKKDLKKLDEKGKMAYKYDDTMESAEEAASRLITFLREVAVTYRGKTVLVVNHGNNMRSLLTHLGYAKFDELPNGAIENTAYILLESDGVDFYIRRTSGVNKKAGSIRII